MPLCLRESGGTAVRTSGMLVSLLTFVDILSYKLKILVVWNGAAFGIVPTDTKLKPERGGATASCVGRVGDPDTILSSTMVGMALMSSQSLCDTATGSWSSGSTSASSSSHGSDSIDEDRAGIIKV